MNGAPAVSSAYELSSKSAIRFIDVHNPDQEKEAIDLDNVVLTDRQKLRLAAQCMKTI